MTESKKTPLDITKPLSAYGTTAKLVTAAPDGTFIMRTMANAAKNIKERTVVVDKFGIDVNSGHRRIWNYVEKAPAVKKLRQREVGQRIYTIRTSRYGRGPVLAGTIRGSEPGRYLIEVDNDTNTSRDDGLFVVGTANAYDSLEEVAAHLEKIVEAFHKVKALEMTRMATQLQKNPALRVR